MNSSYNVLGDYMKNFFLKHINENIKIIKILLFCFVIGLATGIIYFLISDEKIALVESIKETLNILKNENFSNLYIIKNSLVTNTYLVIFIVLSAITIIAPILMCFVIYLKGVAISLYFCLIYSVFGFFNGTIISIIYLIIYLFILLPLILFCINSLKFYYDIFENKNRIKSIVRYGINIGIFYSFIVFSSVVEQLFIPVVINLYK
jgi:hypothetical protein